MSRAISNIIGRKFNKLTVLKPLGTNGKNAIFLVKCECGTEKKVLGYKLKSGILQSCGCLGTRRTGRVVKKTKKVKSKEKVGRTRINLIGKKFNNLTVISLVDSSKKVLYYNCLCDCGTMKVIRGERVRNGYTASCGCLNTKTKIDMIGKKYNKLTVLEEAGKSRHNALLYKVECDCGTIKIMPGVNIRNPKVLSCGCVKRTSNIGQWKRDQRIAKLYRAQKTGVSGWVDSIFADKDCSKERSAPFCNCAKNPKNTNKCIKNQASKNMYETITNDGETCGYCGFYIFWQQKLLTSGNN